MATRAQALIPITIAAAIVGIVGLAAVPDDVKLESVDFPRGTIALDGKFLEVQIADDNPRRVRGLMFQEGLEYDEGMIFKFENEGVHSLWMLNMQFPLDMIWLILMVAWCTLKKMYSHANHLTRSCYRGINA